MRREFESAAIVLRGVDFGEADRVVTFLTRTDGKVAAFAQGARKSGKRFVGGLGAMVELKVRIKESSRDGLASLLGSEAIVNHADIGSDLPKMSIASYAIDLVNLCLQDTQGAELYDTIVRFVRWLSAEERGPHYLEAGLHRVELILLNQLGLLPDLARCARSGADLTEESGAVWLPEVGLVATQARHSGESAAGLGHRGLKYLRGVAEGRFPNDDDPALRQVVRSSLHQVWLATLERKPKSYDFYASCLGSVSANGV